MQCNIAPSLLSSCPNRLSFICRASTHTNYSAICFPSLFLPEPILRTTGTVLAVPATLCRTLFFLHFPPACREHNQINDQTTTDSVCAGMLPCLPARLPVWNWLMSSSVIAVAKNRQKETAQKEGRLSHHFFLAQHTLPISDQQQRYRERSPVPAALVAPRPTLLPIPPPSSAQQRHHFSVL